MSLFKIKADIETIANNNADISAYYDKRYVDKDITYTALILSILDAYETDMYTAELTIKDKTDAQGDSFNKVQSNTLLTLKSVVYAMSLAGLCNYRAIRYKPITNGLEVGWTTDSFKITERNKSCV